MYHLFTICASFICDLTTKWVGSVNKNVLCARQRSGARGIEPYHSVLAHHTVKYYPGLIKAPTYQQSLMVKAVGVDMFTIIFASSISALEPRQCTRWDFMKFAREAYEMGVRYIGGCCWTQGYHIRSMAEEVKILIFLN